MKQTELQNRMLSIATRMNEAIAAKKIRLLRKVGEECHTEAIAIITEIEAIPGFDPVLKEKAQKLFIDVRLGCPISLSFE